MKEKLKEIEAKMEKSINSLVNEFATVRAGRANPAVLDSVKVEYYGTPTPITQMASVSVPEAHMIVIQPWDMNVLKDIEKAINEGADSLGAVQQATKAGSGCGRCSANVEKVTTELLKENK